MAVNTLADLAQQEIDIERPLRDQARQDLATAQAAERQARDDIAVEVPLVHALEVAGNKPAELRRRRIRIAELRRTELQAAADGRAAAARAERASARLAEWEARKAQWLANEAQDTGPWTTALTGLQAVPGQATTLIGSLDTRVQLVDVPPKLLAAVRARVRAGALVRTIDEQRVATAEDLVDFHDEDNGGSEAVPVIERREYLRTRARVGAFVGTAAAVLATANALLTESLPTVPTAAKQKLEDTTLRAGRNSAADAETALRNAQIDEAKKLVERELKAVEKLSDATVDAAGPATAHQQAITLREQKALAFTNALQERVLAWQADAPSAVWSYVQRVEEILVALEPIEAATPASMDTELVDADKAFAQALETANNQVRPLRTGRDQLQAVQLQRKATLEAPPSLSA